MAAAIIIIVGLAAIYGLMIALVATVARNKGRDPYLWALLGVIISPLGAFLLVAILPPSGGSAGSPPGAGA